jgi:HSP20 family molecular chaperone IbpA
VCELAGFRPADVRVLHWGRLLIVEARRREAGAVFAHERTDRFECRLPMAVERRVLTARWTAGRLVVAAQPTELPAGGGDEREISIEVDEPLVTHQ